MKYTREQYVDYMTFGGIERPWFSELFGPLVGLEEEWRAQGAAEDEIALTGFDWDHVPYVDCGGNCGPFGTPEPVLIEENDEYRIERDHLGRTSKLCKTSSTLPLPMDYPVHVREDWEKLKPYFVFQEERIDPAAVEKAKHLQGKGVLVRAEIPGAWDLARELMGVERACIAYYEDPDLMDDIIATARETSVKVLERVAAQVVIDQLYIHEDMAGKSGPMAGPKQVKRFMAPYYRACWEVVSAHGTKLFNQDSDGDMRPVMDAFVEAGVNVMHPFEPAAGMDTVASRKKFGRKLAMLGGIDKHVLRRTKEEIDRELEYKMQPLMREGGVVFALDHRIPNGTPLENYRHYVKRGREILGLPPLTGETRGWGRMAF